jgi:acylphosphatase
MKVCKRIFVSGHVQGVFFRDSTRKIATELNLTGCVRNLRDGRVEVQVVGEEPVVQSLINWLKNGPKLSKVSTIEITECPVDYLQNLQIGRFDIWVTM